MSCRLVTGGKAAEARPFLWAGSDTEAPSVAEPAARSLYSDRAPSAADAPAGPAPQEIEQKIEDAYQRGAREGETRAAAELSAKTQARMEQLAASIEQLALHRRKIQREAEPELVRLSLAVARRILRRELTVDPDALLGLIKAGLEKIESAEVHRIRAHPEHVALLERLLSGAARRVEIAADPGLPVGGVVFETTRGSLDVGLETQLKEIERGFADIYPQ